MEQHYSYKNFEIDVYGDGKCEYEGYYNVIIVQFDNSDKQISQKHIYLKCKLYNIKRAIDMIINKYELLKNNEKITCKLELTKGR